MLGFALLGASILAEDHRAPAVWPRDLSAPSDSVLWTEMRNVDIRIGSSGAIHVQSLRGRIYVTSPGIVPFLDIPSSYRVDVMGGTVTLNGATMTTLMNERVFAYPGAPIRDLEIRFENGQVVQSGVIHKGVDLRFQMWGDLSLDPDGSVRIHPTRMKLLGVNGLSLLHALGLKLSKVLDVSGTNGKVRVEGDDMLIDPLAMIPPPRITGRVAAVRIEGDRLIQTFLQIGDSATFPGRMTDTTIHNYIYYRGGRLRFGNLLMMPADLVIGDMDESDPLDIDQARYNDQLIAGYSRNTANLGLRTWMPDRADLDRGVVAAPVVMGSSRRR